MSMKPPKKQHDGLVGGCPCGCRGDYEITELGLQTLTEDIGPKWRMHLPSGYEVVGAEELMYDA